MSTLTAHDKAHLARIADTMDWATIATVMQLLKWKWYTIPDRTPTSGDLRDEATARLGSLIREARTNGRHAATLSTGGLEYVVTTCPDTGQVLNLYCAFVPVDCQSNDTQTYHLASHD